MTFAPFASAPESNTILLLARSSPPAPPEPLPPRAVHDVEALAGSTAVQVPWRYTAKVRMELMWKNLGAAACVAVAYGIPPTVPSARESAPCTAAASARFPRLPCLTRVRCCVCSGRSRGVNSPCGRFCSTCATVIGRIVRYAVAKATRNALCLALLAIRANFVSGMLEEYEVVTTSPEGLCW